MGAAHVHVTRSDANTMTWGEWRQWPRAYSKATHYSATDPEARLARQGKGREAKLSLSGNVPMENRNGLVVPPWLPRQPTDHVNGVTGPKVVGEIVDILDQLAREGARLMLERALSAEDIEFLGRQRYMPAAIADRKVMSAASSTLESACNFVSAAWPRTDHIEHTSGSQMRWAKIIVEPEIAVEGEEGER